MAEALEGIRVLDLATARAELCGRTFAEFGADVVKVEPPGGAETRQRPPFDDEDGRSLYWETVALGKRSVVADLGTAEGVALVRDLALAADVLIESFDPGVMPGHGLSYETLASGNPGLIYVSVTPYGQTGPKAGWAASDLTIEAAGGRLSLQGDRDRPPVPVGYPQSAFHAGMQAAADAIIALNGRLRTGRGRHLDVSMHTTLVHTLFSQASGARLNESTDAVGTMDDPDADRAAKLALLPGIWECADGYVAAPLTAGALPLVEHIMNTEPGLDDRFLDYDWKRLVADVLRDRIDTQFVVEANEVVAGFFKRHTKAELFELAFTGDFRLGPLQTTRDLLDDPQLDSRGFWVDVDGVVRCGPAVLMSRTPMRVDLPIARKPGSDASDAVRREWAQPKAPLRRAVSDTFSEDGSAAAESLAGVKVADFSWVAVGPTIGRGLADHGATVVRVESEKRLDVARTLAPWKGDNKGPNDSNWYAHFNAGKFGLACDLSTEQGRRVARRLIDWADVVIESFSPGTMAKLGLDYDTVSQTNPGLIMLSTSLLGQTGPMASFAGYGQQGVGLCGISTITGWPDRPPVPPMGAYTDVVAPKYGIAAIAAALHERDTESGIGQCIDMSQVEASIRFIEPLMLDESVNGRTAVRPGLESAVACPHGVYELAGGNRRFFAIEVETDEQWRTLREVVGTELEQFAADLDFAGRKSAAEKIDAALASWLRHRDGFEVEKTLAGAGVPAARVAKPAHVAHDPQLEHRGFFVPLDHSAMGRCDYEAPPTLFSGKEIAIHRAAPCQGEHTELVLGDLLGYGADEIAELRSAGILT